MSSLRRTVLALASAAACFAVSLRAQPAGSGASAAAVKSPVALFRELLAMTPEQRQTAIAIRPPDIQKRILEKLEEYEILPDPLRELRLRETELRWYLRPLMDEPRTNRPAALARVPEELRAQVGQRLELWDVLPPQLQEQFKKDDLIASYFAQVTSATPQEHEAILRTIPADRRQELEKGLDRWRGMSDDQRQKALLGFNQFFQLTPDEKEKTLDTLPDDERREMERTLASYSNLTPGQRAQCLSSFEEFAGMSIAERQQFLKNAERWREMTPEERQKWRELVNAAPIMPPGMMKPRAQPVPNRSLRFSAPAVATN
ncbi:MAG TPA: DUF3106 domain-containing protein [Verrucomicrobiae bacterium]|jgi:hypothetical protein|nr:DUF3106 domain-containing protein [Verrucomicrobiae bacterium]